MMSLVTLRESLTAKREAVWEFLHLTRGIEAALGETPDPEELGRLLIRRQEIIRQIEARDDEIATLASESDLACCPKEEREEILALFREIEGSLKAASLVNLGCVTRLGDLHEEARRELMSLAPVQKDLRGYGEGKFLPPKFLDVKR